MEDAKKPQKGSDHGKDQKAESEAPFEPAIEEQKQNDETDAKKSFKRFLLINAVVIGSIFIAGIGLFMVMVPQDPDRSLVEENARLKARVQRLQEESGRSGERSREQAHIEELIAKLQPRLGPAVVEPIAQAVVKYAKTYDLPPELILSIINNTSRFNITSEGAYGSVGLMHISPKIYREGLNELGINEQQAFHINNNIHLGCMILRQLREQGRSMEVAIAMLIGDERTVDAILVGFTNSMISNKKSANQVFPGKGDLSQENATDTTVQPAQ